MEMVAWYQARRFNERARRKCKQEITGHRLVYLQGEGYSPRCMNQRRLSLLTKGVKVF